MSRGLRQKQTENMNRMILTAAALVCVLFQAYAQRVLTVDEMFSLAESNNRSISAYRIAEEEAAENVRVAKNGRLPSIEASFSASYLGDGWLSDRNFRNGTNAPMPHFGNNFALKATQAIYAALTVYPVRVVPFQHFFQTLSLMGFVRSGLGAPFASAVYGRLMDVLVPQNMQLLSAEMDAVNGMAAGIPLGALYGSVAEQALLVSMKQIYGWVSIAGIAILVFILAYRQPGPVMVFRTWLRRRAGRWFTGRKAVWS